MMTLSEARQEIGEGNAQCSPGRNHRVLIPAVTFPVPHKKKASLHDGGDAFFVFNSESARATPA